MKLNKAKFIGALLASITAGTYSPAAGQVTYTLSTAVNSARANSPQLKAMYLNVAASKVDVTTASLRPNPKLNNQTLLLADRSRFEQGTRIISGENRQVWWQLTKTVQWPGQRKLKIAAANSDAGVARAVYEEQIRNVSFEVGKSWIGCWMLKNKIALLSETSRSLDSFTTATNSHRTEQAIPQSELLRTRLLAEQYSVQQSVAVQEYNNELQDLKLLIGASDTLTIGPDSDWMDKVEIGSLDSLLKQSGQQRTDVLLAKENIASRKLNKLSAGICLAPTGTWFYL